MGFNPLFISALTSTLLLSACGGGSSGDSMDEVMPEPPVAPQFESEPTLFPGLSIFFTEPLANVDSSAIDPAIEEGEQVILVHASLVDEGEELNVLGEYETYCEVSYLPTPLAAAEPAYDSLTNGAAEVIFALENDLNGLDFTSINAITHRGRPGREYNYAIALEQYSFDVVGRGRAFYFNANSDNLIRSAIIYVECFGFANTFFDNAPLIDSYFNSIEFGSPAIADIIFSNDTSSNIATLSNDGEPL